MFLLKGLEVTLLLLVVAGAEGMEETVSTLSSRGNKKLKQLILEERRQRLLFEEKFVEINKALQDKVDSLMDLIGELQNNKKQVAFSGRIGKNIEIAWNKGKAVKFGDITTNIGNAYNTYTGKFRCPVSGLYLFSCNILGPHGEFGVDILQNEEPIARPWSSSSRFNSGSDTAVVHANEGDEIYARIGGGSVRFLDQNTRCSGVLLKSD